MNEFIAHVRQAMHQPQTMGQPDLGRNLLDSVLRKELSGDLFNEYGYGDEKKFRSSLYYGLIGLTDNKSERDAKECALSVLRNLYLTHQSITRICAATHPDKLEGLSAILGAPAVDMTLLVNDWLQAEVKPGSNKVLVYQTNRIYMGTPSATSALGIDWTCLVECCEAKDLREQFQQIDAALARIQELVYVEPVLNSEGFPGPVAGWGGH